MKVTIETRFNPGDVVWRKNLATNEAAQVTISRVDVYYFSDTETQSYCVMYHTDGDLPMCCIPGKIDANNAFATKEEADACPAYIPKV